MMFILLADGEAALAKIVLVMVIAAVVMIASAVLFVLLLRGPRELRRLWGAAACGAVFLLAAYVLNGILSGPNFLTRRL
jgi:predicted Abi (CAAX) family protease